MKLRLLPKFVLSLILLGAVLTAGITYFGYNNSKDYLEAMYADRVINGSKSIAKMLPLEDVKAIIAPGGDQTEAYARTVALLTELKKDGQITYLSVMSFDNEGETFYIDICVPEMGDDPANQIPYGAYIPYVEAAADEKDLQNYLLGRDLYFRNTGTAEPMITDNSYGYNYTGEWPILDENGQAIAEVQYILDMQGVRDQMNAFLTSMLLISLVIVALALLCYAALVRKVVVQPIGRLETFTNEITRSGQFEGQSIALNTGDEIQHLGESFNFMLSELKNYIENLAKVTAEKERIGAELDVARHIQASMLPSIFPPFPQRTEFEIYATMTPAKEVGGDFYDFFLVDRDHLAMVMADVSGKGVPAAMFMMISKTLLKSAAQSGLSRKEVLEKVNNQLCENNEAGMFVTVWLGILEISTGRVRCANAGHEFPAIRRRDGAFELLKDRHGLVLAGMEDSSYREYDIEMRPGDSLFVYTDGVTEATDANERLYGTERMIAALNKEPFTTCERLLATVHQDIDAYVGEAPQFDDITMLCVHLNEREAQA